MIILVGDAPPHGTGLSGDAFPKGCPAGHTTNSITQEALQLGIVIYSVGVIKIEVTQKAFLKISKATGGEFVSLDSVNALIDRILEKMKVEFGKISDDIDIYEHLIRGESIDHIMLLTGKNRQEIETILARLNTKGAMPVNSIAEGYFPSHWKNISNFRNANINPVSIRVYLKLIVVIEYDRKLSVSINLPEDTQCQKLVDNLIRKLELPVTQKFSLFYNSQKIESTDTLSNVGIKDGDTLKLLPTQPN